MKQRTLFGDLMVAISGDGDIKRTSSNPFAVRAEGDISEIENAVAELEMQLQEKLPEIEHELVTSENRLKELFEHMKKVKVVAIDTETNVAGREPDARYDEIAGFSAYSPTGVAYYVPINHHFYEHNMDARWFFRELEKLGDEVAIIMHNSNYDVPVIENYAQARLRVQVDTMIASRVLNENERQPHIPGSGHGLKYLWNTYCMNGEWEESSYEDLFSSRKYGSFRPETVYKYASLDAVMTYQLGAFQMKYLSTQSPFLKKYPDMQSVAKYFWEIEMPVLRITQEMTVNGINYDMEMNKRLQVKYENRLRELTERLNKAIDKMLEENKDHVPEASLAKLGNPVNVNSSEQLAILLYDVLQMELNDALKRGQEVKHRKNRRTGPVNYRFTGEEALKYFEEAYPEHEEFMSALMEYREVNKIYTTFIIRYREYIDPRTNKIHAEWNTTGADTGRMSCRNPNLQQLPSRNPDIRPMFTPNEGNVFVACDYSAQEPRLLAYLSQDPVLVENFKQDKDIYSTLISTARGMRYDECTKDAHHKAMEEWEASGRVGERPVNYRDQGKTLQLALSYGLGPNALSEQLNITRQEADQLMRDFRKNLSTVFEFEKNLKQSVKKKGYLKTIWGNKRRFPNYALPELEIKTNDGMPLTMHTRQAIYNAFDGVWKNDERRDLRKNLEAMYNVKIWDNKSKIGEDETRILNSLIQGSGAGMLKKALVLIYNDKRMRELGGFPVLLVHDEIIIEGPKENQEELAERLEELMLEAAYANTEGVPFKAEAEVMERWTPED